MLALAAADDCRLALEEYGAGREPNVENRVAVQSTVEIGGSLSNPIIQHGAVIEPRGNQSFNHEAIGV